MRAASVSLTLIFLVPTTGCLLSQSPGAPGVTQSTLSSTDPTSAGNLPVITPIPSPVPTPVPQPTSTPTPTATTKQIPYMIGYTAAGSTAAADIQSVNGWLGRPIDISAATLTMTAWWYGGIPKNYVIDVSFPMLTIAGWDNLNATDLGVAATGGYDKYYTAMADALARAGNPMIVRIGWEMNGDWYPWSINNAAGKNNTGANYIATFRRIATILRARVPGVKIEFCTNWQWKAFTYADGTTGGDPLAYWPGKAYVDYVSMDIYQANIGNWQKTQSTGAYNLDWLVAFARQQGVRVGLPEWGANPGDAAYLDSAIQWMNALGPLFAYSVYSSWDPAAQFIKPGDQPALQSAFTFAYRLTKFGGAQ